MDTHHCRSLREANQDINSELQRTYRWSPEGRWVWGWEKQVMGMKESPCHDEHQALYGRVESRYCTPETDITLYVNILELK